jgi:hypothetical protein
MYIGAQIYRISYVIEQMIRIVSMQFILAPAAYALPRKLALRIANTLALLLLILPIPGLHTYRQMRSAFGKGRLDSFYLAWGWLARPLSDFVILKRLVYKRENPFHWRIVEKNVEGINSLRESGESYIIVSAHCAKQPGLSMFSPDVTHANPVQIANPLPERILSLYDLRIRLQYWALLKAYSCWQRSCEFVYIKNLRAARTLYSRLSERGNVVFIPVDAPWGKTLTGSYERPFAGSKSRVFSTGAAQLAQLAKCPIISCVPLLESDGTVVLEWGEPIRIVGSGAAGNVNAMNKLFDTLEIAVGERPTQYIFEIGCDRRWNSRSRRWEDLTE